MPLSELMDARPPVDCYNPQGHTNVSQVKKLLTQLAQFFKRSIRDAVRLQRTCLAAYTDNLTPIRETSRAGSGVSSWVVNLRHTARDALLFLTADHSTHVIW